MNSIRDLKEFYKHMLVNRMDYAVPPEGSKLFRLLEEVLQGTKTLIQLRIAGARVWRKHRDVYDVPEDSPLQDRQKFMESQYVLLGTLCHILDMPPEQIRKCLEVSDILWMDAYPYRVGMTFKSVSRLRDGEPGFKV